MEVIVILLPLAIILALLFIGAFMWVTLRGQYDDLDTPKFKILLDDKYVSKKKEKQQ